jgi:hypothetical protein
VPFIEISMLECQVGDQGIAELLLLQKSFFLILGSLHATPLRRTAAVMRNRSYVADIDDFESDAVQRPHRGLAPRPWALYHDFKIFQAELQRRVARALGRHLSRKWRALA